MATILNFLDAIPPEKRRRPEHLKHEGGYYKAERRIWHHDSVCKDFQEAAAWNYLLGWPSTSPMVA